MARQDDLLNNVLYGCIVKYYRNLHEVLALAARVDPDLNIAVRTDETSKSWCATDLVSACRDRGLLTKLRDLVISEQLELGHKDLAELYSVALRGRSAVLSVALDKQSIVNKMTVSGPRFVEEECTSSGMKIYLDLMSIMESCSHCGIVIGAEPHATLRGIGRTLPDLVFDCAFFLRVPVSLFHPFGHHDLSLLRRARPLIECHGATIKPIAYQDDVDLLTLVQDVAVSRDENPLKKWTEEISGDRGPLVLVRANEAPPAASPREIRIFLASSSELEKDRDEFDLYFRQQNDQLRDKGFYLKIVRCEGFLDAMSNTRLQDEYNKSICDCDIFVSLFFTKTGKFTEEEFNVAHSHFKEHPRPLIYTFFKKATVDIDSLRKEDFDSLRAFQTKLKRLGHFYTTYGNTEHLKLQFRDQLDKLLDQKDGPMVDRN